MPGRVREYNAIQAAAIAATLGIAVPGWGQPMNLTVNMPPAGVAQPGTLTACPRCQHTNAPGARFCTACGSTLAAPFPEAR